MKIFFSKTEHNLEQRSKAHFKGHCVRKYDCLTGIIISLSALIFALSVLSCTDPVAAKKKHFDNGVEYL